MTVDTVPRGRAWTFGDNIPTDHIVSSHGILEPMTEVVKRILVQHNPRFAAEVRPGDILVAGIHFGQSSGRQIAAKAIKAAGVGCVLADSLARTFWRNCWEIGMPALELSGVRDLIGQDDDVELDIPAGHGCNHTRGVEFTFPAPGPFIQKMWLAGGIVPLARSTTDWNSLT